MENPRGRQARFVPHPWQNECVPAIWRNYSGQEHLLGPGKPLRVQIEHDGPDSANSGSMILWGPPGVGKTTLAKIIAETTRATFIEFSAVMSGIKEIKQVMASAAQAAELHSRTILFVDEIHRFNKAQQDAFLPYVERGTIRLIGATTENPSFEIISALLSRCRVYVLQPLSEERIGTLLRRALEDTERGLGPMGLTADDDALQLIASYSSGDCRNAYNTLEVAAQLAAAGAKHIDRALASEAVQQRVLMYDKSGEEHYNLISALHKSVRNSDPDAAPLLAGPHVRRRRRPALSRPPRRAHGRRRYRPRRARGPQSLSLGQAGNGVPGLSRRRSRPGRGRRLPVARAQIQLRLHRLWRRQAGDRAHPPGAPCRCICATRPTRLMKELDYSKGYRYAHDEEGRVADMDCLPDSLKGRSYYQPTQEGREKLLAQRMDEISRIRESKRSKTGLGRS